MALQDILKKIQAQAENHEAKIEQKLTQDKAQVDADIEAQTKAALLEIDDKTASALTAVDTKIEAMGRSDNRQALLASRRRLLDAALESLYESLVNADKELKTQLYTKLAASLAAKEGTISVAKGDKALLEAILKGDFTVTESADIKGGFVYTDNGTEIDNTFRNLIFSEYRQVLELYLADQLKLH